MKTFEGIIIKSDYGDCEPDIVWWIKNQERNMNDGRFLESELQLIGEGKKVRLTLEEI